MKKPRFVVLASGRGSNFEAIFRAHQRGELSGELIALLSDRSDARCLEFAKANGIPNSAHPFKDLKAKIQELNPDWIVMAGFMRVVPADWIRDFRLPVDRNGHSITRIINIHPSLLPAFPGLNSYQQAYEHGCHVTGVTVHSVEEDVDAGPIFAQRSFSIVDCEDVREVEARGLAIEHQLYPQTLRWIFEGAFDLRLSPQGRLCVHPR